MRLKRFVEDRRGGVGMVVAISLPLIAGMAAFAIDLGSSQLEARRLQGIADSAALAAAADPAHAQTAAQAAVNAAGWPRTLVVKTNTGDYDPAKPAGSRFQAVSGATGAVRVSLSDQSPTFFARVWGRTSVTVERNATAAQTNLAAFSIGSRLASLQGGILNALLSALTGSTVSLTVMDYQALAGVKVDLLNYVEALRTSAGLTAGSYNDTLDAQVTTPQMLEALAASLPAGNAAQAAAIRNIAAHAGGTSVKLATLIDLGALGGQTSGGKGIAQVDALTLLNALAQVGNGNRQVQLDLGGSIAGLAQTRVWLAIGQRPAQSPWITVTASGAPILRTAQARLYAEVQTPGVSLPNIGPLVQVKVPLYVELASAEAKLSAIECGSDKAATIDARPSLGQAAITAIDTNRLADFSTPMPQSPARLVDTALIDIDGQAAVDLGAAESWQALRFDQAAIDAGMARTVSSGALSQSVAASLMSKVQLAVHVIGLPIPLGPLTQAVGQTLTGVAPALDTLIDATTGAIGVHFGEADVRVTGLRCGMAQLVG